MSTTTKPAVRLTRRVREIQISPTLAVAGRAQDMISRGIDVVDFGPGEPDFPTPPAVAAAGRRAIAQGLTKYTNVAGTKALRDAIAARYAERWGADVTADHVIAGTGGKQELFNVILALVEEGDEVIIPSPYWVSFPDQVQFAGGRPVFAKTEGPKFPPTLDAIEAVASDRTRGVIINSPCNPTGAVIAEKELERLIEWCSARDAFLMFDETYEFFVYGGAKHVSAMRWFNEHPETIITVNSMSKTFAMTGWRLGFALAHPAIISAAGKIQSHSTSNPSSISQAAALEAIRGDHASDVQRMYDAYSERRAWLVPAINAIAGLYCSDPDGAFYIFPEVKGVFGKFGIKDSHSFAEFLLEEARVAVVPGSAFGSDDHIRISYATSMDRLREGVKRMEAAIRGIKQA
jgi:aspartate aminotransferase